MKLLGKILHDLDLVNKKYVDDAIKAIPIADDAVAGLVKVSAAETANGVVFNENEQLVITHLDLSTLTLVQSEDMVFDAGDSTNL